MRLPFSVSTSISINFLIKVSSSSPMIIPVREDIKGIDACLFLIQYGKLFGKGATQDRKRKRSISVFQHLLRRSTHDLKF